MLSKELKRMCAMAAIALCFCIITGVRADEGTKQSIVIRQGFQGSNAYFIVCKGYPKEGTSGLSKRETAKEAALLNAQMIAKNIFDETVDVVKNGRVKKFIVYEDYAVVYYLIEKRNLNKRMRQAGKKK